VVRDEIMEPPIRVPPLIIIPQLPISSITRARAIRICSTLDGSTYGLMTGETEKQRKRQKPPPDGNPGRTLYCFRVGKGKERREKSPMHVCILLFRE
jgi:hypothetical protein